MRTEDEVNEEWPDDEVTLVRPVPNLRRRWDDYIPPEEREGFVPARANRRTQPRTGTVEYRRPPL